jgi:choline kinase
MPAARKREPALCYIGAMKYKVLLPTSGTGSRLGEVTRNTNKSLVPLNGRPTIDYILDSYPKEATFVVTLGYLGQSVKDHLEANHPERKFEFVWVDRYEGPGSSLGYSMLKAKENLQCPFIFHACDNIYLEEIPLPDENWIGGYVEDWSASNLPLEHYRTQSMKDGRITHLNDKGIPGFDSVHIGLDGIHDYGKWWQSLEEIYDADPNDAQISDVPILNKMIESGSAFKWVPYKVWLDTGNLQALQATEEFLRNTPKRQ